MSEIADVDQDIKTIMSQTNYNEKEAEEKYNQWDGDYISVIKEYLNPDFLPSIVLTNSCNLNIHLENLSRFFKSQYFNGNIFIFFLRL